MKLRKRFAALCATAIVFCSSVLPANAANYNVHYQRYATNNVTQQTLYVGQATEAGKVTVKNTCTTFNYATKITTYAEVYCVGPQGQRYYTVTSVENTSASSTPKDKTGTFLYVSVGNTLRNEVILTYDSASYYYQEAKGITTSF